MTNTNDSSIRTFDYTIRDNATIVDVESAEFRSDSYGIYGYSFKPDPTFFGCKDASNPGFALTYGLELETDDYDGTTTPNEFAHYLHSKYGDRVYCKHDGSLSDGAEIVSHPATLACHMRKFGWADILHVADKVGAKSHDTSSCGLHIHVGRNGLGQTDEARELCIAKLLILMDRFYETELFQFSRRKSVSAMQNWAHKVVTGVKADDHREQVIEKCKNVDSRSDRYTALNLTNRNTIEFRIFRGTLNPQTLAATIQLVDALVRYCKTHTLQQVLGCKFGDVVAICKYAELATYCSRRHIDITTTAA